MMRAFIYYFDRVASFLGNLTVFLSIFLAALYFVLPEMRRWVELNLTNRYSWYTVGKIKPESQTWARYARDKEKLYKNFYHSSWNEWDKGRQQPITPKLVRSAVGDVVVHTADFTVMGRKPEAPDSGDRKRSNNTLVSVSKQNDCLVPKGFSFVDINGNEVGEKTNAKTIYVWMWAAKVSCQ